ncbi:response regulator transcription factor [Leucobacter chromiireducens]|uniref:DNA-binding response regulator n=1 Tax=Leucobacter chromiireducens subsp. solipictus TaxID=398235 RepID=A0ABS1SCT8_9MICO|nr:response regulator transcription factor [Leucobacter chromiireducens]MBL3678349.1 DNA-binding response regulator [Leucobacter chromiireducens subsp. solipictus]
MTTDRPAPGGAPGGAPGPAPSVLIADDHAMIREGLRMILERQGIAVLGEAADGASAVRNTRALRPDVVLMDLRMPGMDGIAATRQVVEEALAEVLVLTSFDEDELVFSAIRAGAAGFLLKTTEAAPLAEAVRRVASGEGALDPRVTRRALAALASTPEPRREAVPGIELLTEREQQVLAALAAGDSNSRIAARLRIALPTVKTHVSSILMKLGAENRTHAVAMLRATGSGGGSAPVE